MVDGLHILVRNRTMKLLAIALSGRGRDGGEKVGGSLTNVQCKPNCNCHNEPPLYNYILMKKRCLSEAI
jgi:hypothetical protein